MSNIGFRTHLRKAHEMGFTRLRFEVNLEDYKESDGSASWSLIANPGTFSTSAIITGKSGIDVLEKLVNT